MDFSEAQFRRYFRQMYPQLAFYAVRLVGEDDADDILQEAFIELWNRRAQIESEKHCKSFLYRVIYTRALNVIKHRKVTQDYTAAVKDVELKRLGYYDPADSYDPSQIEDVDVNAVVDAAIDELPAKGRQIFIMSYIHGMSNKDIANIMGISVRTVEVHIYRALKFLRSRLANQPFLTFFVYSVVSCLCGDSCNMFG
jgi:RNA polymerase sigma-70 factor (ECF subfamily)